MMRSRYTSILAVAAASSLLLSGCSGSSSAPEDSSTFSKDASGSLNAWGFDNADDVGKARLDYAAKQLPDVKITMDQTPFDAQKFTTRAASGNVPDVVQMDRALVATYAAQGLLQPLDACYKAQDVDPSTQFYPAVTEQVKYQDKTWAVPQFYQPPAIIVNKTVLDAAGVKVSDIDTSKKDVLLAAIAKMYKASGGNPTTLGFDPVSTGQPELWLLGNGGKIVDDNGAPVLDDPANAAALKYLKQINDAQGGYAKVKSFSDSFDTFGKNNQFVKNQVGAQVNAQWYVNVLAPYASSLKITGVPFKDQSGQPFAVAGGTAFVIPAGAKNPNAACAWMTKLTATDAWMAAADARAKTLASKPGSINTGLFTGSPEADKMIRSKYVKSSGNAGFDSTIATYYDVVASGKSLGASPAGQEIKTELLNAVTSTLLGNKTAEKALADAQAAAKRAYDQATAK